VTGLEATIELLRRRKARANLLPFTVYTKPDYEVNWHHRLLAAKLQGFVSGQTRRLMVFMPPRHGKSELVSRRLPAFALGLDPSLRIIACSHTASLSSAMNRDVQRIIDGDRYRNLFPATQLSSKFVRSDSRGSWKRTTDMFEIVDHGGYYLSAGVGGSITGMGFDLGIIDDPIKSREEADSPTYREKVWQWYVNDFYTRRQADAKILLTLTRWHRDDLAGRLLRKQVERDADQWDVLVLPGLKKADAATPGDPRAEGEALWPSFMDQREHRLTREQDPRSYAALYDQDPAEAAGAEWPPELFGDHLWCEPKDWPRDFDVRVVAVDPSKGKDSRTGDYSAIVFVGVHRGLVYVDADLERRTSDKIVRDTLRMCDRYKPDFVGIEANQFQELLVDQFERATQGTLSQRWPIFKMFNRINKAVRVRRLGPYLTNRELRFKGDSPGCRLLVDQLIDFPLADHDDGPDALEMALRLPVEAAGGES